MLQKLIYLIPKKKDLIATCTVCDRCKNKNTFIYLRIIRLELTISPWKGDALPIKLYSPF